MSNRYNGVTLPRPRPDLRPVAPEHIHYPFQSERPETSGTGHRHWGITAFTKWGGPDNETMVDSLQVEVEAESEQDAIFRAMELVQRPYYRVTWVREVCSKDESLKE